MIGVSDEIKQAYDISTTQVDKIILNNQEYRITNVEFYDDVYSEGNIFGTAIAKCLEFEIENIVDLEGKEIEYQTGIIVNGSTQWISLGNFIIQDIEPNDTTNIAKVSAIDYMIKSNIPYESNLNYGDGTVTLLDVLQEVCTNSAITLATMEFPNSTFIVDSNQFAEGTLNRQVFQAVAQISGTIAKIKNNQLHLIGPGSIIRKVFTLNNYEEAEIKRATHPINLVSLGMTDIEGENVLLRDDASISLNGENSLVINDNPFAYTQAKREKLITALFDAVKGFEYKAYSFKCQGLPYLETMDKIQFLDKEKNTYDSYVFRFNYKSPNGLESTIEAPSIIKATVAYQNVLDALEISKRTEILVDKQNQKIESVVSQADAQNQKISVVEQTVNELNSKISDIADITTSKESTNGTVSFEKINQSEPIYVRIYPTGINISYLYPHANLFPSETLFPKVRTLRFTNTTTNEYFDYELPTDLLYFDAENYDEFILDYDAQSCVVNKRVGYNADGTTYVLETPRTIEYEYPRIELTDGDYVITLLGYHNAYLFVRLMAQNIYTTQFATKAEMNSEIRQTVEDVNIGVDKKLTSYPTTTQMNSAINVKADSITSSVSRTYATKTENANTLDTAKGYTDTQVTTAKSEIKQTTDSISSEVSKKVGNDEIISKINQSAEAVQINANKISLDGKEINLTSDDIIIKSNNFNVDKYGNLTCKNATIVGNINAGSSITGSSIVGSSIRAGDYDDFYVTKEGVVRCRVLHISNSTENNSSDFTVTNEAQDLRITLRPNCISMGRYKTSTSYLDLMNLGESGHIYLNGTIEAKSFSNISCDKEKENIHKLNGQSKNKKVNRKALDIINDADVCEYNYKGTNNTTIGLVIGNDYKTPDEILNEKKNGIDLYSMSSLSWKGLQEAMQLIEKQDKQIKQLQKETEKLKKEREK